MEQAELIEDERETAAHSRGEIATGAAEHDDGSSRHVLAAVIADSFDHCYRAAVAHREALTGNAREVRLT